MLNMFIKDSEIVIHPNIIMFFYYQCFNNQSVNYDK